MIVREVISRIAVRNIPINMIALWPESESRDAEKWLMELDRIREESCELKEKDRPDIKPLTPTSDEKKAGYVVFATDYMDDISPYAVPDEKAIASDINLFAARNEFEPATFGIYPLKELKDVTVKISDLKNESGDVFSNQNIDVQFVKYMEARAEETSPQGAAFQAADSDRVR